MTQGAFGDRFALDSIEVRLDVTVMIAKGSSVTKLIALTVKQRKK